MDGDLLRAVSGNQRSGIDDRQRFGMSAASTAASAAARPFNVLLIRTPPLQSHPPRIVGSAFGAEKASFLT